MESDKIKILYCMETIASGGVEQRRLLLTQYFDRQKFEIKIICTEAVGFLALELKNSGVEIIEIGVFKHLFHIKKYLKILEVIKQFKPHIIHGAVFEGMAMTVIGGVFGKVPIRLIEETSHPITRSKKAVFLQKIFSAFSDKVIAISPSVLNYLILKVKVKKEKVLLITNGVKVPSQTDEIELQTLKSRLGIGETDIVVGIVGRVYNDIKRFSDIIDAVHFLNDKNVKILVVGVGPDLDLLREKVINLGISNQMITVGYQENPKPFYELMDIFCLPSAHEGFGLVAAEAMLHKLPVIATKVGGLQDIVVDGETGFLVPPYSPDQIAEKLKILIINSELRESMGKKGYERAIENYTADRYCQEVENLYLDLLKEKGLIT